VYFPLIVKAALMVEPTETESKETLDQFILAMKDIARQAKDDPVKVHDTPKRPKVSRPDEAHAARNPRLRWRK
jgi:glycine dehydrogenase subunit 2